MIVDDDDAFLCEMQEVLESSGYHVLRATTSSQALTLARASRPDVFLLDLKLGADSGFELARQLRHAAQPADPPVIAMTGYFNMAACNRMISCYGITACLQKPFHPRDVIAAIEQALAAGPVNRPATESAPKSIETMEGA